jgi:glucose/arabinose dehydrogenase
LIALQDTNGAGHADNVVPFGPTFAEGTGIAIYKGYLFAETNDRIVRYSLPTNTIAPAGTPETVVSGLPLTGDHPMHPFQIDGSGDLYVDLGSATNSCQSENRMPNALGNKPCTELETRAGIWRYDADKLNQHFSPPQRFSTGLRNGEGISFDSAGRMFGTQHGRDQKKFVLAPEYGGDGGKAVGVCAQKQNPVAAFPAHWAPNDMLIYEGSQFPSAYKDGAFIAFHGSWNRAPAPLGGYNLVFQPLANGQAADHSSCSRTVSPARSRSPAAPPTVRTGCVT